jgi:anti-sigma regulatory factor (Ser/Thr protein kinase)
MDDFAFKHTSPLAALQVFESDLSELSEEKRVLLRSAVDRIQGIANHLLESHQKGTHKSVDSQNKEESVDGEDVSNCLLLTMLDDIVSEKRLQYKGRSEVEINGGFGKDAFGAFVRVQKIEFKRVISNLMNNAVEAIEGPGCVGVSVVDKKEFLEISVQDNGKGISKELLPRLMQKGETHGKKGGSGLGLFHAKQSVETWGGRLEICSAIGEGSVVKIILPKAKIPNWFAMEIRLSKKKALVILDDDPSIHEIWKRRLKEIPSSSALPVVHHLKSVDDLESWLKIHSSIVTQSVYLVDYELLNGEMNGMEAIQTFGLEKQSILITSRFEDKKVQEKCQQLGVRLLPKGLASLIPIIQG